MAPSCRLDTLKKKASQLSTLCGVDVCFLCFSPDGGVLTWPEKEPEVRTIISRYAQQSKKRPLCCDAKKRKGTCSSSQSDHLLGLLNAKLSILNEKILGLERQNGDSWMDLDPSARVCDSEIWRELELGELGCGGEEGECSLSPEEIESWVSALAAEGEMIDTQSDPTSSALSLNEQTAYFEKNNGTSQSPLCVGVEQGLMKNYLVLNDDIGLSLEEIESWVPALAEGEMATQSPSSDMPNSALSLNEQTGYFEKKNETPLCVEVEKAYLVLNEEIRDLVDASASGLCEEEKLMNSDSELGDTQFWGAEQLWEFGEAKTMEKKRLSWDWNLLPIPIDC